MGVTSEQLQKLIHLCHEWFMYDIRDRCGACIYCFNYRGHAVDCPCHIYSEWVNDYEKEKG